MSTTKKPAPVFAVRLVGPPGIKPWSIPARVLTRIVNAVQQIIERTEPDELFDSEEEDAEKRPTSAIQLLNVTSASAAYQFAAVDGTSALRILGEIGAGLSNPRQADWDEVNLSAIYDISAAAKALDVTVEIREKDKKGNILAAITPQSYKEISEGAFVTGESSVYGYLERVGGATDMRCAMRLPDQEKLLFCRVATGELIRRLGKHIYENIRVFGTVTWVRSTWRVKTISIHDMEEPKRGSILEALGHIYDAGGKAWDDVEDPDAFIAELRQS